MQNGDKELSPEQLNPPAAESLVEIPAVDVQDVPQTSSDSQEIPSLPVDPDDDDFDDDEFRRIKTSLEDDSYIPGIDTAIALQAVGEEPTRPVGSVTVELEYVDLSPSTTDEPLLFQAMPCPSPDATHVVGKSPEEASPRSIITTHKYAVFLFLLLLLVSLQGHDDSGASPSSYSQIDVAPEPVLQVRLHTLTRALKSGDVVLWEEYSTLMDMYLKLEVKHRSAMDSVEMYEWITNDLLDDDAGLEGKLEDVQYELSDVRQNLIDAEGDSLDTHSRLKEAEKVIAVQQEDIKEARAAPKIDPRCYSVRLFDTPDPGGCWVLYCPEHDLMKRFNFDTDLNKYVECPVPSPSPTP